MLISEKMRGPKILSKLLLIVSHLTAVSLLGDGKWESPEGCSLSSTCEYKASWSANSADVLTFTIVARQNSSTWTAIGFAQEPEMEKTDVAYGFMDSANQGFVIDGWIELMDTTPTRDAIQNFFNTSISYVNGYYTMVFSRNRTSTDSQDYSMTNSDCYYFFFPVGGGSVLSDNTIIQHFKTPDISTNKICISTDSGSNGSNSSPSSSSVSPTTPSSPKSSGSCTTGSATTVAVIVLTFLLGNAVLTMTEGLVAEINLRQQGNLEKRPYAVRSGKSMKQETSVDADLYEAYETMNAGGVSNERYT